MEKIESAQGMMGMPRVLSFPISPASPQHKEASSEERGLVVSSEKFKMHTSSNCNMLCFLFSRLRWFY